jgi:hypothetical protein
VALIILLEYGSEKVHGLERKKYLLNRIRSAAMAKERAGEIPSHPTGWG